MRISVVRPDGVVVVDGEGIKGVNLDQLDADIHAIQWFGDEGEIERVDTRGRIISNEEISSFVPYQWIIDAWQSAKDSMEPLPE